jgi:iron-sulfur cluster assembly accessory protein
MSADNAAKTQTEVISITSGAVEKVKALLVEKELTGYGLRVFVAGGGCSGFQYGMAFENNPRESDTIQEADGLKIIIDPMSLPYLQGASIDFVDNLMGGGFRIDNPNAVSTCGCGHSFSTKSGSAPGGAAGGCSGCG